MVLAGGEGRRLRPLTNGRSKPAVPFGGCHRLIDFALSNLLNGGIGTAVVLSRRGDQTLHRHLGQVWGRPNPGMAVRLLTPGLEQPPYAGSASAILDALEVAGGTDANHVLVFGADHLYRIDPALMLRDHVTSGADATVATIPVPLHGASGFGVVDVDDHGWIRSFVEKPTAPSLVVGDRDHALASMGIYVFSVAALRRAVLVDRALRSSRNDVGGDILPFLVSYGRARVFDFANALVPGQAGWERGYWRDIGTIDSYHAASMDLVAGEPRFDLFNGGWPIRGDHNAATSSTSEASCRRATTLVSTPKPGSRPARIDRSIVTPGVKIGAGAVIADSVLFANTTIGDDAVIRNAIVDEGVRIPPGWRIGVDPVRDRALFFVSPRGVVVVTSEALAAAQRR